MATHLLTLVGGPANLTQLAVAGPPAGNIFYVPVWEEHSASLLRDADSYLQTKKAEYEVHRVSTGHLVGVYTRGAY